MPSNKNAVVRYKILDELLSNKHRYYTRKELHEICNKKLVEKGYPEVTKRTIELDLHNIETEFDDILIDWDFYIDGKQIIRYADQSKTIFTKKLSSEEVVFLKEVLNTIGQFSGLDNFEWVDSLQRRLISESKDFEIGFNRKKIISFSTNPYLSNESGCQISNALPGLFSAIANQVVVSIEYRKFGQDNSSLFKVYPYLLKQYNNRWYLICQLVDSDRNFLMNLALDRILSYKEIPEIEYKDCLCDIDERFEDIVGVTYYDDEEPRVIRFAVSNSKAPYIKTKPVHGSQVILSDAEQSSMKEKFPALQDYTFFKIECIPNNELKELFFSYDKEIIVLDKDIQTEIVQEMNRQLSLYKNIE